MSKRKKKAAARGAGPFMMKFTLPDYCDISEIVVRELDGTDDPVVAMWAEQNLDSALSESFMAIKSQTSREEWRQSIVSVDGVHVQKPGEPYMAMDGWGNRTMEFVVRYYNKVNGVEVDDVKKHMASGEVVGDEMEDPEPGEL